MPWLKRDGVSLFYEDAGDDGPPLVLVHGWGCNHTFMAPQFTNFRGDHRVVAVDLRGHGRSDKPRQSYTIPAFADDLAWVCRERDLERPLVIGHSMGGAIAIELAAEKPDRLAGIVLLDTAVLPAPDVWAGVQPVLAGLHTPGYRDVVRQFLADSFFLPTDDPQRKAWAIDAMLETSQTAALARICRLISTLDPVSVKSRDLTHLPYARHSICPRFPPTTSAVGWSHSSCSGASVEVSLPT